ncbi:sterol O-acyltransferase 1-like [Anoplophora glabripennis]|uniref:sterol O-acyltransferase 1-like n=1 Tax=Anoplophora glabripennis TaxID=217634 RepID=UPI0008750176|nr:sterol O-acyltransferase 1-like [Anoplophora glabripennis]
MSKSKPLPEGNIQVRESILTELFESNVHIRTVRNLFVVLLLYLFVNTVATDYFQNGESQFGFRLIKYCFGKVYIAALAWVVFVAISFLCYLSFKMWANIRIVLFPKSTSVKLLDFSSLSLLVGYYIFTFHMPMYVVRTFDLPLASATIVLAEQVRIAMKIHAFVRTNAPKVLNCKPHVEDLVKLPTFWNFLYFMFAPTLIYKDEYPRTKTIRWSFAACRLLELFSEILFYSIIFDQYMLPPYRDFGTRKFTWTEIFLAILKNSAPAMMAAFLCFYMVLHSVQNFFAEILRFGDRAFYADWWTSTEYSVFYRKWNLVVHNWLHIFVYRDVRMLMPMNKVFATVAVFVLSSLVHEWGFCNMSAAFIPVVSVEYLGLGMILYFVKMPKSSLFNVLFLFGFAFGTSALFCFYNLEYYARQNAPIEVFDIWHRVLPRLFTCDCIQGLQG